MTHTSPLAHDETFRRAARRAAIAWKGDSPTLPEDARRVGSYRQWPTLPFCLPAEHRELNLLPDARAVALERFTAAGIPWHDGNGSGPSNHLLDSQVNCVNALAPFVTDPVALRRLLVPALPIAEVIAFGARPNGRAVISEFDETDHIVFEWQGCVDHLHEWTGRPTRGSRATSADAAIRYVATDGQIEIALIEWKFTERYPNGTLSSSASSLETRRRRYGPVVHDPDGPIATDRIGLDDLFTEPVYQLARLALLASCIENACELNAARVRVLYIAPSANTALWHSPGSERFAAHAAAYDGRLDLAWPALLRHPDRLVLLDSATLTAPDAPTSVEYQSRYRIPVGSEAVNGDR